MVFFQVQDVGAGPPDDMQDSSAVTTAPPTSRCRGFICICIIPLFARQPFFPILPLCTPFFLAFETDFYYFWLVCCITKCVDMLWFRF